MGAVLAGTLQAPLTAVVFAIELTHDFNMAMPLVLGCFAAYAVMVLSVNRSILTEKIARRGYHLSREYSVDPLEAFLVKEAMRPLAPGQVSQMIHNNKAATAHPNETLRTVVYRMVDTGCDKLIVIDSAGRALGSVALKDLLSARVRRLGEERDRHRPLNLRLLLNRTRSTTVDVS
jgi:hypothetical protein